MEAQEGISRMTIPLPVTLKRDLQANAEKHDRRLSQEIVHTLRVGLAAKAVEETSGA